MQDYTHNTTCRICGGDDLAKIMDLGQTPPANAYLQEQELSNPEPRFPLVLYYCRTCSLVQLLDVVDPKVLFGNYHFVTSASPPSVAHFKDYANQVIMPLLGSRDDLVIDIGGNDGVLLSYIKDHARVLNVDAADNLAAFSNERGVPFYPAFFTSKTADDLVQKYGLATVVTANNVFAHTDPLGDVFKGVARLIGDNGVFVLEVHWVKQLVEEGSFDQIYHEHLCFHSLHALNRLIESVGMTVFDVEVVPVQGQSLRIYAAKRRTPGPNVARILAEETAAGLTTEQTYRVFAQKVEQNKATLLALLSALKAQNKSIAGYGAPAKSTTLLNYYGLGRETLDYLTDSTSLKQGLYSPGMHIPIVSPETLYSDPPDYILLLAWNYKDAILKSEKALRERGVKFILTIPEVAVI